MVIFFPAVSYDREFRHTHVYKNKAKDHQCSRKCNGAKEGEGRDEKGGGGNLFPIVYFHVNNERVEEKGPGE